MAAVTGGRLLASQEDREGAEKAFLGNCELEDGILAHAHRGGVNWGDIDDAGEVEAKCCPWGIGGRGGAYGDRRTGNDGSVLGRQWDTGSERCDGNGRTRVDIGRTLVCEQQRRRHWLRKDHRRVGSRSGEIMLNASLKVELWRVSGNGTGAG
jgi:hypothetical protein